MVARQYSNMEGVKKNMFSVVDMLKTDTDAVALCTGIEGSGKTTAAMHICKFIHEATPEIPPFTVANICFTFEEYQELLFSVPKYSAILVDELINFGFNREGMNRQNLSMMKGLFQCRSKNLFLFMIVPDLFSVDRIIRDWRSSIWFVIPERGKIMCHRKERSMYKKDIWWELALVDTFKSIKGKMWKDYLVKKEKAFMEMKATENIRGLLTIQERRKFGLLLKDKGFTQSKRALIFNVSTNTIKNDDGFINNMGVL